MRAPASSARCQGGWPSGQAGTLRSCRAVAGAERGCGAHAAAFLSTMARSGRSPRVSTVRSPMLARAGAAPDWSRTARVRTPRRDRSRRGAQLGGGDVAAHDQEHHGGVGDGVGEGPGEVDGGLALGRADDPGHVIEHVAAGFAAQRALLGEHVQVALFADGLPPDRGGGGDGQLELLLGGVFVRVDGQRNGEVRPAGFLELADHELVGPRRGLPVDVPPVIARARSRAARGRTRRRWTGPWWACPRGRG